MEEYQEVIINWTPLMEVENLKENGLEYNNVLYQIYGDSPIYGKDVLLYIGKTVNAESRIKTHLKGVFGRVNNLKISIGTFKNFDDKLEVPESILIANHKPSFNKEYIHLVNEEATKQKIIILNHGSRGALTACCTNYWWIN